MNAPVLGGGREGSVTYRAACVMASARREVTLVTVRTDSDSTTRQTSATSVSRQSASSLCLIPRINATEITAPVYAVSQRKTRKKVES